MVKADPELNAKVKLSIEASSIQEAVVAFMPQGRFDDEWLLGDDRMTDFVREIKTGPQETFLEFWAPTDFDVLFFY